jgi:hypothetical protein
MKKLLSFLTISFLTILAVNAQQPWQKISDPDLKDLSIHFINPPSENGLVLWWGWDGPVNEEVIKRDLDKIKSFGFKQVMIEAGYNMTSPYLSPGWFEMVKTATEQARIRGMRVWVEDEGKYPSGFAGGKFSAERPDLKMQALVMLLKINIFPGIPFPQNIIDDAIKKGDAVSAIAYNLDNNTIRFLPIENGTIKWEAPAGRWQITLAGHQYRTSQTRSVNNPTRGKDTNASLFDYLNPDGTKQFIAWTHEQYKKYLGDEFGKTFMGLRGDEPDFGFIPWTPKMLDEFKKRKGYDIQPYLASFFLMNLKVPDEEKRAKADYWDVWSSLFRENFFDIQANWCAQNNIEYNVHLNHEEMGPALVKSEGDFFKDMRHVGVPGVDAIWSQIWMDHEADYPKLASSAAHLFGRPRSFTESFAAFTHKPTVTQAKWVVDYQLVRGINLVEIMFMPSSAQRARQDTTSKPTTPVTAQRTSSFFATDSFPPVAQYMNRASYLLSSGRPAAQIALYFPTSSMWMGDDQSNTSNLAIVQKLLEKQLDFDFVDEQALSSVLTVEKGALVNLSGQSYKAVIIPSITALSQAASDKLKAFVAAGGKVIFMGREPSLIVEQTFLKAKGPDKMDWAIREPSGELTQTVLNALPHADVTLDQPSPSVKYLHRRMKDGELYFFFNEGAQKLTNKVILAGKGKAELWNAFSGKIETISGATSNKGFVSLPLTLEPYETKFIIINTK